MTFKAFVLAFVIASSSALDLPSYIKPCSLSDPNLKECLKSSVKSSLPILIKGDKTYKIPLLYPIKLPYIEINLGDAVQMKFNDSDVFSFDNPTVKDASYDPVTQKLSILLQNPEVKAKTHYNMRLKLLGIPISGAGPATLAFTDVEVALNADLKTIQKNGVDHFVVENTSSTFKPNGADLNFENLFNGDPRLGPATNQLLNDNWMDFFGILEPTVKQLFAGILKNTLSAYFGLVPKDKVFLP